MLYVERSLDRIDPAGSKDSLKKDKRKNQDNVLDLQETKGKEEKERNSPLEGA